MIDYNVLQIFNSLSSIRLHLLASLKASARRYRLRWSTRLIHLITMKKVPNWISRPLSVSRLAHLKRCILAYILYHLLACLSISLSVCLHVCLSVFCRDCRFDEVFHYQQYRSFGRCLVVFFDALSVCLTSDVPFERKNVKHSLVRLSSEALWFTGLQCWRHPLRFCIRCCNDVYIHLPRAVWKHKITPVFAETYSTVADANFNGGSGCEVGQRVGVGYTGGQWWGWGWVPTSQMGVVLVGILHPVQTS